MEGTALPLPGMGPDPCFLAGLEALLFASREPVPAARLAEALGVGEQEARAALAVLAQALAAPERGLDLMEVAGGYRLFTKAAFAEQVELLLQPERSPLTPSALETLAIIAYRQPVTRPEIEAIRGVQCERSVRTLLERQLIREAGRREAPGRPILYATTHLFLEHFGLRDLAQLPPPESFPTR